MAAVAATTAFGVGSVGVLAAACCINCSAPSPAVDADAEPDDLVTPELPPELCETNSRLKSVLAALDPAAGIEPCVSTGSTEGPEDAREDKQLRMALTRVSILEAELAQTQVRRAQLALHTSFWRSDFG